MTFFTDRCEANFLGLGSIRKKNAVPTRNRALKFEDVAIT